MNVSSGMLAVFFANPDLIQDNSNDDTVLVLEFGCLVGDSRCDLLGDSYLLYFDFFLDGTKSVSVSSLLSLYLCKSLYISWASSGVSTLSISTLLPFVKAAIFAPPPQFFVRKTCITLYHIIPTPLFC